MKIQHKYVKEYVKKKKQNIQYFKKIQGIILFKI